MSSRTIAPVAEFLELCAATRQGLPVSDITAHDEWVTDFRHTLEDVYGLDMTDPAILVAVAAGCIEHRAASLEQGDPVRGVLAVGWALADIAGPLLTETVPA